MMFQKPEPRDRVKRRAKRRENSVVAGVRLTVQLRDGRCRLEGVPQFAPCVGAGELAHIGERRRFKTRGLAPEDRHRPAESCMLCGAHHRAGKFAYDLHRMAIEYLTEHKANGPMRFTAGDVVYEEPR